ncbi:hypothetical protein HK096_011256 [Nowakowskiella sp. JEL0078]|nr:hypothetical protein HK096_011256 [Nowakowskiella sp. JEL0078]
MVTSIGLQRKNYIRFIDNLKLITESVPMSKPPKCLNTHLITQHPFADLNNDVTIFSHTQNLVKMKSDLYKSTPINIKPYLTDIPIPRILERHVIDPSPSLMRDPESAQPLQKISGFRIQVNGKRGTRASKSVVFYGRMVTGDSDKTLVDFSLTSYTDKKGSTGVRVWVGYER